MLALVLAASPFVLPHIGFTPDMMSRIMVWGLLGLGFDLLFGFTGLLSFGQAAFYGVGGFVCAYLVVHGSVESVWLAMLIGVLASMLYGCVIGALSLRRGGIYFAMITLAFGEVSFFLENSPLASITGGENGLPGVPVPTLGIGRFSYHISQGWPLYALVAALFWLGFVLASRIVRSPVGAVLRAIKHKEPRVAALGHYTWLYKLAIFVIAAGYSGLAGALLGILQGYMPPTAFSLDTSTQLLVQSIIGGVGTLVGPLVGATIWIWLLNVLQFVPRIGSLWKLILGAVFVALVMGLPGGVVGAVRAWWKNGRAHAWLAERVRGRKAVPGFAGSRAEGAPAGPSVAGSVGDAADRADPRGRAAHDGGAPEATGVPFGLASRRRDAGDARAHPGARKPRDGAARTAAIRVVDLAKHYGGVKSVDGVTLSIEVGELHSIIGPNGAGKSTFFNLISGAIRPTHGDVYLHGVRVTGRSVAARCQLGLCKSYQINQLFEDRTVRENIVIAALANLRGPFRLDGLRSVDHVRGVHELVDQVLESVELDERAGVDVRSLAYGEKRRLEIGLALATSPDVLLLDEPLAGMSPEERSAAKALLGSIRKDRTLVIVEHDMDAIFELSDRITVFKDGRVLADGTVDEIRNDSAVRSAYLGAKGHTKYGIAGSQ